MNITINKAVLEQAIDALAIGGNIALAGSAYTPKSIDAGVAKMRTAMEVLRKALAQPQPVQQYLAHIWQAEFDGGWHDIADGDLWKYQSPAWPDCVLRKIHTSPQAAQPLTREQRNWIIATCPTAAKVIDAVEQALSIKGTT